MRLKSLLLLLMQVFENEALAYCISTLCKSAFAQCNCISRETVVILAVVA